jgi:hypothetical protein
MSILECFSSQNADFINVFLEPLENFLPLLTIGFARNRPDGSIQLTVRPLKLSHRSLAILVDGDVLVIHKDALSVVIAGEAKDIPKLSLLFGFVRLLIGDKAERVVSNDSVRHGVRKAVLKDQATDKSPTPFHNRLAVRIRDGLIVRIRGQVVI